MLRNAGGRSIENIRASEFIVGVTEFTIPTDFVSGQPASLVRSGSRLVDLCTTKFKKPCPLPIRPERQSFPFVRLGRVRHAACVHAILRHFYRSLLSPLVHTFTLTKPIGYTSHPLLAVLNRRPTLSFLLFERSVPIPVYCQQTQTDRPTDRHISNFECQRFRGSTVTSWANI